MGICGFSGSKLDFNYVKAARQAPLSVGLSRQEYWSGLPCPPPGDLPDPGIQPESLVSPALTGGLFTTSTTWGALSIDGNGPGWSQRVVMPRLPRARMNVSWKGWNLS